MEENQKTRGRDREGMKWFIFIRSHFRGRVKRNEMKSRIEEWKFFFCLKNKYDENEKKNLFVRIDMVAFDQFVFDCQTLRHFH